MSGSLAMSGVFSNIDTSSLVKAAVAARSVNLNNLKTQQTTYQSKETGLAAIQTAATDLSSALNTLSDHNKLRNLTANADSSNITAQVSDSATAVQGSYQILVNRLATADRYVQAGLTPTETWKQSVLSSPTADDTYLSADQIDVAGGKYQFKFQFGTNPAVTVDLSSYDDSGITLNQLIGEINAAAGYTAASAVQDGSAYRLQLQAPTAGSSQALQILDDHSVSLLGQSANFTQTSDGAGTNPLVGAGTLVYSYNGKTRTITTDATTTLSDLAKLINNDAGNPGVSASVMTYDGPTGGRFHLVLGGSQTGASNTIAIEAQTTLAGFAPGDAWTHTQVAQSAQVRIDGYPSSDWITSDTNTMSGLVPGVNVTLQKADAANPVTLTVNSSSSYLQANLQSVVDTYNKLVDSVKSYTGYDASTGKSGMFQGDSTITNMAGNIRGALIGAAGGFVSGQDAFLSSADLGLTIDKTGKLSLDTTVLSDALSKDYEGVVSVLSNAFTGVSASNDLQFGGTTSNTQAGNYELQVTFAADGSIASAGTRLKGSDTWNVADVSGNTVTAKAGQAEAGMAWKIVAQHAGQTLTYQVGIQEGFGHKAATVASDMLGADGMFTQKKTQYDSELAALDTRITQEQARVDEFEKNEKAKYARMETTLAQLDSFRAQFSALFASTGNNTNTNNNSKSNSSSSSM
jgi:flagellar hook-associated protein 2